MMSSLTGGRHLRRLLQSVSGEALPRWLFSLLGTSGSTETPSTFDNERPTTVRLLQLICDEVHAWASAGAKGLAAILPKRHP